MSHDVSVTPSLSPAARSRRPLIVFVFVLALLGLGALGWTGAGQPMPWWVAAVVGMGIVACSGAVLVLARPRAVLADDSVWVEDAGVDREGLRHGDAVETPGLDVGGPDGDVDQRMWLPLAARLQALLLRQIREVDGLEKEVEDPELLNGLFRVDHLVVQALRLAETLGVLGGQPVHRSARETVPVRALVRAAISEVSRYTQVEVSRIDDVSIVPAAHGDLRHVLAELIDNATWSSPPDGEPVVVRAVTVRTGLKIIVCDHGLAPESEAGTGDDYARHNAVLAGDVRIRDVLTDGRYGLAVVGLIAARRGLSVWLELNKFGGTDAVIVVPQQWLVTEAPAPMPKPVPSAVQGRQSPPRHRLAGEIHLGRPPLPQRSRRPEGEPAPESAPRGLPTATATAVPGSQAPQRTPTADSAFRPALPQRVPSQQDPAPSPSDPAAAAVQRNAVDPASIGQVRDVLTNRSSDSPELPGAPETLPGAPEAPFPSSSVPLFSPAQE